MKKIVAGLVAVTFFIFSATAQETHMGKHSRHHQGKGMMMQQLNLSESQKAQLKTNRESTKSQLAELNKDENITVKEYKTRKAAILKSQKATMENVLTPEQKQQLAKNKMEFKAKRQQMTAKRMEKMKTALNLTDEQLVSIKSSHDAGKAKAMAIRENSQLSKKEKKAQLMAVRTEQKNNLKQLLTAEQITRLEEMKKARMDKTTRK